MRILGVSKRIDITEKEQCSVLHSRAESKCLQFWMYLPLGQPLCPSWYKKYPVSVEDLLVDIYFHFHHSAKHKKIFSRFLEFTKLMLNL